ncbi:glycosyltransferase family 2 protein [Bacillus mycoides]|uniref:glycosyltransferase family 2 protein n=1 Tax=Bacillus cereus group TaxID=86661 RepID=UPI0018F409AF|nr:MULTISPECIES: glycosyltransferase family 2 protein [Bacillus cereus group]MBJ8017365.1 glycosyltransferase family 2 protein [Bacillus cereus group sp. N34]QWG68355.1 glycosyltransferase family 2 protein [Bacillus mycoides]QWH51873.1 glycosyltransferase family 2 protein [Bacillus mycoides]QWI61681.1 glycosyltransferase family 2 protein [Bacillus mycoides]QWI98887.1 glycosyltransferase family 2 protein [Bacillus mycoides]
MENLTIFTPTYNRAYCLTNCYESLKRQTCKNFIWLIIDDGSSDNTKELVDSWIAEKYIKIMYHWQQNQGMHGAHNTAYEMIDTELNICIDSDDYMPNDAVEKILSFWSRYGNDEVSGIIGLDLYTNGQIIGSKLPENLKYSTLFNLYNKHGVTGDKKLVYRTELTKKYPYPIFKNEKYVGLAYKYYMLDQQYEMLLMNEPLCYVEYMPDGSSMNMLNQYRKNPRGFAFYRKELMKLPFTNRVFKYRQAVHYVSSSFIAKNKRFMQESPCKGLTICALPLGVILYSYITMKTRMEVNI